MFFFCFFFKHKTAYEMRISDWSSDVCSSDLSDNVEGLKVALGTGEVWDGSEPTTATDRLTALGEHHLGHIRTSFGRFTRQVSGSIGRASCRERVCQYV